ncbi:MAG: hypothetical protein QNJ65_23770 [Xenococcaceae cyanobacterium MO_234.B1]|nr:hypothetical protein [Xenococcaceae cyanobacterium MO_234.B1]
MIDIVITLPIEVIIISGSPKKPISAMKTKKTYSIEKQIAIQIDLEAARQQVSSSSIVETAVKHFLQLELVPNKKTA